MKVIKLILIVSFIIPILAINALASTDNKYYSEYALKHKINDKFDLFFTPEFRANNDMSNIYYYQWRLGSTYRAHKNLDFALAYRYIQTQNNNQEWDKNDTQYLEMIATPKTKLAGFILSDANKFETRFIEDSRDRWVYRNLSTAAYPVKIGNFEFAPYVSEEFYYDFEIDKIYLNWVTIGANKKINKYITVGLYGRNEAARTGTSSKWVTAFILGSNITIDF